MNSLLLQRDTRHKIRCRTTTVSCSMLYIKLSHMVSQFKRFANQAAFLHQSHKTYSSFFCFFCFFFLCIYIFMYIYWVQIYFFLFGLWCCRVSVPYLLARSLLSIHLPSSEEAQKFMIKKFAKLVGSIFYGSQYMNNKYTVLCGSLTNEKEMRYVYVPSLYRFRIVFFR